MKKLLILVTLLLLVTFMNAQVVTAILPNDFCQNYNSERQTPLKIELQISGINETTSFINKSLQTEGVINLTLSNSVSGLRTAKIELAPYVDFDFIKTLFIDNGIRFINNEGVIISIDDWKPFTNEQCSQLFILNRNINNIEGKMKYVLADPYQKSLADSNGWFVEANGYLVKAKEDKSKYLETIK
jgi:hypothetical protein